MRFAIVSDIHANMAAWRIALKDIADLEIDQIICLGDMVGYGPDPVGVMESVYQHAAVVLRGNHDAAVAKSLPISDFNRIAADSVGSYAGKLSQAALEWLQSLPLVHKEQWFSCTHGDFTDPAAFNYLSEPEDARANWEHTDEQLLFAGHTHLPGIFVMGPSGTPHFLPPCDFEMEPGKRYIVNPGSIGYPRTGNGRSSYCIFDTENSSIVFRELHFDSAGLRHELLKSGMQADTWLLEQEQVQKLPHVRKSPLFALQPDSDTIPPQLPDNSKSIRELILRPPLISLFSLVVVFLTYQLWHLTRQTPDTLPGNFIPEFTLPVINAYPLKPADKNLLPPLPLEVVPPARLTNWRYMLETLLEQHLTTGLRSGAITLVIHHQTKHSFILESPLINLAGIDVEALQLNARIRKLTDISGEVLYQVITYTTDEHGMPQQHKVESYDMRSSRRKLHPPAAERNVRIRTGQRVSHAQLRIRASFKGRVEIEQPALRGVIRKKKNEKNNTR